MFKIIIGTLLLLSCSLIAQNKIQGKVTDINNAPVKFSEVLLINKDSIVLKNELTNDLGNFNIETEPGDYSLKIKQRGKIVWHRNVIAIGSVDLGVIKIDAGENLNEVLVKTSKKTFVRKLDRLLFNVENSLSSTGGNAIDVLKVTPGLQVANSGINIIGKNSVTVMTDGRLVRLSGEDLINFLSSIPADNIKSVEVITAPPAKYDAAGNSGIININLKKLNKEEPFNANINSSYEQKTYAAGTIGGNINSQVDRLSIYTNVNYKNGAFKIRENRKYFYPDQLWDEYNNKKENINLLSGRIGMDYKLDSKNELGASYLGSLSKPSNTEIDQTNIYDNQNELTDYYTKTASFKHRKDFFHSYNVHYKNVLDSLGKSISGNIDYLIADQDTDRTFDINSFVNGNSAFYNAFTNGNQNVKITTSNIDVELPYKKLKYNFGGKVSFIDTNNFFNYYDISTGESVLDTKQSNEFKYTENTQAVYFSTESKMDKWEFQIGLRAESTQTKGFSKTLNETNKSKYIKLFPTAYASYNVNDKNQLALNYSRRVGRPSYYMTNPFRTYINDYSYIEGNPFIQPEFNNNIELSHTYNDNLTTSLSFGYLENGKSQVQLLDPITNVSKFTYLNFCDVYSISFDASYTLKKGQWLESYNYANLFYKKTIANAVLDNQIVEMASYYFNSNNTFILNKSKTFFASLDLAYRSPQIINISHMGETFNINAGAKYFLLNKNLQFALNFYDLLRDNKYRAYSYSNGVKSQSNNYADSQFMRFSVLYKFGNSKINVREKKRGNETESNRAN